MDSAFPHHLVYLVRKARTFTEIYKIPYVSMNFILIIASIWKSETAYLIITYTTYTKDDYYMTMTSIKILPCSFLIVKTILQQCYKSRY